MTRLDFFKTLGLAVVPADFREPIVDIGKVHRAFDGLIDAVSEYSGANVIDRKSAHEGLDSALRNTELQSAYDQIRTSGFPKTIEG